ncbi:hypothetical protein AAGG42_22500, partial [Stenotrophomonas maltophilia]|uniref:hypothetical protein n=1 Tax=Stenotrophomonas maltophilia TaxID=40324 RepID=UPI003144F4A8
FFVFFVLVCEGGVVVWVVGLFGFGVFGGFVLLDVLAGVLQACVFVFLFISDHPPPRAPGVLLWGPLLRVG